MTPLENQWRREESAKWVLIALVGILILALGGLIIAHSITLLAVKCSL